MSNEKKPQSKPERRPDAPAEHQIKQVDFLMGRERQKDLVQIVCALVSNEHAYEKLTTVSLVQTAKNILIEIEQRGK